MQKKKDIIKLLFDTGKIDLSLRKGSGEDLLDLAKRNQLYDFIVTQCLREDWAAFLLPVSNWLLDQREHKRFYLDHLNVWSKVLRFMGH